MILFLLIKHTDATWFYSHPYNKYIKGACRSLTSSFSEVKNFPLERSWVLQ